VYLPQAGARQRTGSSSEELDKRLTHYNCLTLAIIIIVIIITINIYYYLNLQAAIDELRISKRHRRVR